MKSRAAGVMHGAEFVAMASWPRTESASSPVLLRLGALLLLPDLLLLCLLLLFGLSLRCGLRLCRRR